MSLSIIINTLNRKEMLIALLQSIIRCEFDVPYQIVVVDDCSDENYGPEITHLFPDILFLRNEERQFLIRSRNRGWRASNGEFVFLVDDDNEIKDRLFFKKALKLFGDRPEVGVIGCRTYYFDEPNTILIGQNRFNKMTGKTYSLLINKKDEQQPGVLVDTHDTPNAFFTKRDTLEKVGGFSEEIVQTFSEADFAEKVRACGRLVMHAPVLRIYHKSERIDPKSPSVRMVGTRPERLYYFMRNRSVFIKKWGNFLQIFLYFMLFSHLYSVYYLGNMILLHRYDLALAGAKGVFDGYVYIMTGKLRNRYAR